MFNRISRRNRPAPVSAPALTAAADQAAPATPPPRPRSHPATINPVALVDALVQAMPAPAPPVVRWRPQSSKATWPVMMLRRACNRYGWADLPDRVRRVLDVLCDHADDQTGHGTIALNELAASAGMARSTLYEWVWPAVLATGLVAYAPGYIPRPGRGQRTRFRILKSALAEFADLARDVAADRGTARRAATTTRLADMGDAVPLPTRRQRALNRVFDVLTSRDCKRSDARTQTVPASVSTDPSARHVAQLDPNGLFCTICELPPRHPRHRRC